MSSNSNLLTSVLFALFLFGPLAMSVETTKAAQNDSGTNDTELLDCTAGNNKRNCDECGAPMPSGQCCPAGKTCKVVNKPATKPQRPVKGTKAPTIDGKPVQAPPPSKPKRGKAPTAAPIESGKPVQASPSESGGRKLK
jgi:hypothetical protein